jgi:hypothetical protein
VTDWATEKALDIIAARKLTTKVVYDDNDTPFATITSDNSAVLIAEALREEREQCASHLVVSRENGRLRIETAAGVYDLTNAQWRPIETAPKDKNIMLATDYAPFRVTEGWWEEPEHGEYLGDCGGECRCPEYGDTPEPMWLSTDGGFTKEHPPTHWMPVPAGPEERRS